MRDIDPTYLVLIPLAWCLISWTLSRLSGWSRLARLYPVKNSVPGAEKASLRSGRIGTINYYSCLNFQANEEGLRIAVALPLRLGHRPMFVPWDQFHRVSDEPVRYSHRVRMLVGKPSVTRVVFPGWVKYHMPLEYRELDDDQ